MKKKSISKYTEKRPWGQFEQFTSGEPTTVKILTVEPNQALSLQYHHKREEFWKVIFGTGHVLIGDEVYPAEMGDEFFIKKEQKHRIKTGASKIKVLEISFGEFDENDIVRIDDIYNR